MIVVNLAEDMALNKAEWNPKFWIKA